MHSYYCVDAHLYYRGIRITVQRHSQESPSVVPLSAGELDGHHLRIWQGPLVVDARVAPGPRQTYHPAIGKREGVQRYLQSAARYRGRIYLAGTRAAAPICSLGLRPWTYNPLFRIRQLHRIFMLHHWMVPPFGPIPILYAAATCLAHVFGRRRRYAAAAATDCVHVTREPMYMITHVLDDKTQSVLKLLCCGGILPMRQKDDSRRGARGAYQEQQAM